MTVIVPLGGLGQRFQNEGHFSRPKPFVRVFGKEMILWVLDNLSMREDDELVLAFSPAFMSLGTWMRGVVHSRFPRCHLVELPGPTRGAAETVLLALRGVPEQVRARPVMLCDGDCYYTHDIVTAFRQVASTQGASFVFHDTQPEPIYSYCKITDSFDIIETKEKVKISDWANSGCYCFRSGIQLEAECAALLAQGETQLSQDKVPEYYTSGVIARMLARGDKFKALVVPASDINVLGTPSQVEAWCRARPTPKSCQLAFCLSALCPLPRSPSLSLSSGPDVAVASYCKECFRQGHRISILAPQIGPGGEAARGEVVAWLKRHEIDYHELLESEPNYDFLVCRDALDPLLGTLERQSGFYTGGQQVAAGGDFRLTALPKKDSNFLIFGLGVLTGVVLALTASRSKWASSRA